MLSSEVHFSKACVPISVTLLGLVIDFKLLQSLNNLFGITVMQFGRTAEESAEQFLKTSPWISVTLLGIDISVSDEQK